VEADPAQGFAALMSQAHDQVAQAADEAARYAEEAPYGYTTDPDGTRRPKKTPGRPRKSPSLDELKTQKDPAAEAGDGGGRTADRPPSASRRMRRSRRDAETPAETEKPVPQFRQGVIAKGINRLYRKGGKIVRVMDPEIGQALIEITRKEDDEDVTVGEAWEELARTNPRIRGFLLRLIAGGAWGQLFAVHGPILLAILMKDAIRKRLPFMKLIEAFLADDTEDGAPAAGTPFEGMTMPDMQSMMAMAQQFAEQAMGGRAPGGTLRPPALGPAVTTAGPAASGS